VRWLAVLLVLVVGCGGLPPGVAEYNAGVQHQARGERVLAEQQYRLALQKAPDMAEAHLNLGVLHVEAGWLDGAEQEIRQAIALLERDRRTLIDGATYEQTLSLAYGALGTIHMQRAGPALAAGLFFGARAPEGPCREGLAVLRKAVELDRTNAHAQAQLAHYQNIC
jgi:Flp pilus assembly protein TadD